MEIIGHRGARNLLPQNTLPSFELALSEGLDFIELDARLTKDGKLIIFHDDDVGQITRGQASGPISGYLFKDARKLNVNDGFEDGKTYQIPTLKEVFDLVDNYAKNDSRAKVNVELKGANTAGPVSLIIKKYLETGWRHSDFLVSSFRHKELEKFKKLIPEIEVAVLLNVIQWAKLFRSPDRAVKLAKKNSAAAINPNSRFVNPKLVNAAHGNSLKVNVYTVNNPDDIRRMSEMGVDGIFTDDFRTARQVLRGLV